MLGYVACAKCGIQTAEGDLTDATRSEWSSLDGESPTHSGTARRATQVAEARRMVPVG